MAKDWSGNGKSTFITIGASNHTEKEREEHDFYATDPVTIDRLVRSFELPKKIWECACGTGSLSERLIEFGHDVVSTDLIGIDVLKGKTLVSVDRGIYDSNDALFFKTADGEFYIMTHNQECCENVYIDDICGDFADLLNEEILTAEELNNDYPADEECIENTYTWTFYHLATFHGDVSIRWFGTSNGYYSESVEFYKISEEDYNVHTKNK